MPGDEADRLTDGLSLGEQAAVGRIGETLFGNKPMPVRFGRYQIVERIGSGAFGSVYRAHDPELARDVALKVLLPSAALADPERISSEARAMAAVSHPNVIAVYDVGLIDDVEPVQAFIAMELVEGQDMRRWLQGKPPDVRSVLAQAGAGLAAAHRAGIVHGDFKPDNVLVETGEGRSVARVGDFGLAQDLELLTGDDNESSVTVTATSVRLRGTPAYMGPELLAGGAANALSDQFAFFVTVYEALHGERPFEGKTPSAVAAAICSGRRRGIDSRLPRHVRRAIARGLSMDPADRFSTMEAALTALRPRRRRVLALGLALVGVGTAAALTANAFWPSPRIEGCESGARPLQVVWNETTRSRGTEAYAATGIPYARQAWGRASAELDAWANRWTQVYDDACGLEQAPAQDRALRVACLRAELEAFGTTVDQLLAATPKTVRATAELTETLPDLQRCEGAKPRELEASGDRAPVVALVQQARGKFVLADYEGAAANAEEAARLAAALGDAQLEAHARAWAALARLRDGTGEPALEPAMEAYEAAVAAGEASIAALVALGLVRAIGYEGRDPKAGAHWLRQAQAQLERAGRPPPLVARALTMEVFQHQLRGDIDAARRAAEQVVQTLEAWDPNSVGLVDARGNAGALAQLDGDTHEAVRWLDAALAQAHAELGPQHPASGEIASNQLLPLITLGQYRDAFERGQAAMQALGDADPDIHQNLGIALQLQGAYEDARAHYRRALELRSGAHGEFDPRVAQVLVNLADLDARTGRLDDALAEIGRARTVFDAAVPPEHPALAIVYATECLVHRQRGTLREAVKRGDAAHAIAVKSGDAMLSAGAALELGEALRQSGDPRARDVLRSGLERARTTDDVLLRARLAFALARALPAGGEENPALLHEARELFPAQGDPAERDAIQSWPADR